MPEALQTHNMHLSFDEDKRVCTCTWGETTTRAETLTAFDWIVALMDELPTERSLLGTIIDFSAVVIFAEDSLWTEDVEPENTYTLHQHRMPTMNRLPTAIVVKTLYQATYIGNTMRGLMLTDPTEALPRVRVVRSLAEAEAHITTWHATYADRERPLS